MNNDNETQEEHSAEEQTASEQVETFEDGHGNTHPMSEIDNYFECHYCDRLFYIDECREIELECGGDIGIWRICDGCFEQQDLSCCDNCGIYTDEPLTWVRAGEYASLCSRCYYEYEERERESGSNSNEENEICYRSCSINKGKEIFSSGRKKGKIIKSPRMFGVEFEIVPDKNVSEIDGEFKFFSNMDKWGVGDDGSLSDGGVEVTTPPMSLSRGEDAIIEFCSKAKEAGWTVDRTCGTHVHLDAPEFKDNPRLLRRLVLSYLLLDNAILKMLPRERRRNRYCSPLNRKNAVLGRAHIERGAGFTLGDFINSSSISALREKIYKVKTRAEVEQELQNHYSSSRYYGINFHSLWNRGYGTIEIRYHHGTLNSYELLPWIAFHQHILDNARKITDEQALLLKGIRKPDLRLTAYALYTKMDNTLLETMLERIKRYNTK
jgi:hypothetical protein